jgi:hypothetical protein
LRTSGCCGTPGLKQSKITHKTLEFTLAGLGTPAPGKDLPSEQQIPEERTYDLAFQLTLNDVDGSTLAVLDDPESEGRGRCRRPWVIRRTSL